MARATRSNDWGFPRWREYGSSREAKPVRLCDREGCSEPGDRPAPKSPNSPERWYFCETHAAEYNRNWDYFAGLTAEEAAEREAQEQRDNKGYKETQHYSWTGPGDGRFSRDELNALKALELDEEASFEDVKTAWRKLAKEHHPDKKPGDSEAYIKFQTIQAAFEVMKRWEERRLALGKATKKSKQRA